MTNTNTNTDATYRFTVIVYTHRNGEVSDNFTVVVDDFTRYVMEQWDYTFDEWADQQARCMWGDNVPYIIEQIA